MGINFCAVGEDTDLSACADVGIYSHILFHFVWATWDRQPLITDEIERRLDRYIASVCDEHKCKVLAVGRMPDHMHLLVLLSNTISLAQLMKEVKGGSSRLFSQILQPGEWFAWQGSYSAFAVSPHNIDMVTGYIANQKRHHGDRTFWAKAEDTGESH